MTPSSSFESPACRSVFIPSRTASRLMSIAEPPRRTSSLISSRIVITSYSATRPRKPVPLQSSHPFPFAGHAVLIRSGFIPASTRLGS